MPRTRLTFYDDIPVEYFLGDDGDLQDYLRKPTDWRPGDFDPQLGRLFLQYIQLGLTDRQACIEVPMNEQWARSWARGSRDAPQSFVTAYNDHAKILQLDMMANDIVEIADGTDALGCDFMDIVGAVHNPLRDTLHKSIKRNREDYRKTREARISARKWYVSKLAAKKYGDRVQLDHGNADDKPFKKIDYGNMSVEDLELLESIGDKLSDTDA